MPFVHGSGGPSDFRESQEAAGELVGRTRALAAFIALLSLAGVDPALAAPPPNDGFASALVIAGERGTVTGTNVGATKEASEPAHAGNAGGASVWYRWIAPRDGQFAFSTAESDFDTLLAVYQGAELATLTAVGADDDSADEGASELSFFATAGTTYHIAVDGFLGKAGGIVLSWGPAPRNDNFVGAFSLAGRQGTLRGTARGATKEPGEPRHGGERADTSVWFRWTAPEDGPVGFAVSRGYGVLGVYTGTSVETLAAVSAATTGEETQSGRAVTFRAVAGTTYSIALDHASASFDLGWGGPPANDDFRNATRLTGARGGVVGTNVFASREAGEPPHVTRAAASVWYRWRAPRTGRFQLTTAGSSFDTVLAVYTGARIDALARVAANDDAGPGVASAVRFRATAGRVYRIAVDGFDGDAGEIRLGWRPIRPPSSRPPRLTGASG